MHSELDHSVHEAHPLRRRQAIGVKEKSYLLAAAGGGRETGPFRDVVVVKLSVQPSGFRQLPEGVNRPGEFPVDERDRGAVLGDNVPRTRVTVTETPDDCQAAGERMTAASSPPPVAERTP